jgi:hypothetical protein
LDRQRDDQFDVVEQRSACQQNGFWSLLKVFDCVELDQRSYQPFILFGSFDF